MAQFIEITVSDDEEGEKPTLININNVGRIYPNPQNTKMSIVELNYHSINDAPVYLETTIPYEKLRTMLIN